MTNSISRWVDEDLGGVRKTRPQPVYLRFGRFDRRCRSYNHHTGDEEPSLSVYRAHYDPVTRVATLLDDPALTASPRRYRAELATRCVFPVQGIEVTGCTGSDNEPLLRQARVVDCAVDVRAIRVAIA